MQPGLVRISTEDGQLLCEGRRPIPADEWKDIGRGARMRTHIDGCIEIITKSGWTRLKYPDGHTIDLHPDFLDRLCV